MFQHRSSVSKSQKKFKGKSKGKSKRLNKGKVEDVVRAPIKNIGMAKGGKNTRVNRAKQIMLQKKNGMRQSKRLGTDKGTAKIVGLIPLSPDVDLVKAAQLISGGCENDALVSLTNPRVQILRTNLTRPKQRMLVYACPRDVTAALDIAKVADIILFIVTPKENATEPNVDALSWQLTTVIKSQGIPSILGLTQKTRELPPKKQLAMGKTISRFYQTSLELTKKTMALDTQQDASLVLCTLATIRLNDVNWRSQRSYLMAESIEVAVNPNPQTCSMRISGHLRGEGTMHPNNIIHITGYGDYQAEQIDVVHRMHKPKAHSKDVDMKDASSAQGFRVETHARADMNQQSMMSLLPLDELNREQSIITDEEIRLAELEGMIGDRQIPGALTKFQGLWDEISDGEDEDDDEKDAFTNIDVENTGMTGLEGKGSLQSNAEAKMNDFEALKLKKKLERDEVEWPDEVETPPDQHARIRFARYRGLKNFAHSEWDVKESLPLEYGHLTQFQDFDGAKRRVLMQSKTQEGGLGEGSHVIVQLKNVPVGAAQSMLAQETPVLLWALLEHERQVSVVHCRVRRHNDDEDPIKQKEDMEVHIGFRRFETKPIYAVDTGKKSRSMTERFFHQGRWTIASFYSHIIFPPASVLMFRKGSGNDYEGDFKTMVANGTVISIDPDKLLLKRIILTANPVGVHKRSAVCRYMFYNPEDIRYFKPVELRTKYGLTGHIREARGTKGFMKCIFDGMIKAHDTICMHLYKRQFPKWIPEQFS